MKKTTQIYLLISLLIISVIFNVYQYLNQSQRRTSDQVVIEPTAESLIPYLGAAVSAGKDGDQIAALKQQMFGSKATLSVSNAKAECGDKWAEYGSYYMEKALAVLQSDPRYFLLPRLLDENFEEEAERFLWGLDTQLLELTVAYMQAAEAMYSKAYEECGIITGFRYVDETNEYVPIGQ